MSHCPSLLGRALARRAVLLAFLALCGSLLLAPTLQAGDGENAEGGAKVSLVIDYGDGVQKRITLPWKKSMTVFNALEAAAKHPRGIDFKSRGKGETLFVTAIDDCENEGSGRNWTYRINDKSATESCGIAELSAGDVVLWKFASYR